MFTNSKYLENGSMTVQPVPMSCFEHDITRISRYVTQREKDVQYLALCETSARNAVSLTRSVRVRE